MLAGRAFTFGRYVHKAHNLLDMKYEDLSAIEKTAMDLGCATFHAREEAQRAREAAIDQAIVLSRSNSDAIGAIKAQLELLSQIVGRIASTLT